MLLIISAKMAYSLWRYFSFSAEYTAVSPSANKPPRADAKTFDKNDVQLISQQNWFGKYQPVATPVKQPEPVPVAETRLNVVLRGIAFGARPGAVIEEGGKQQVYLQGERLGSHNAVIEEINRDHVMLRYQGKIERLSLAEEGHSTVLEGIQTAAAVSANRYVEQQLLLAADRVREGSSLRAALAELRLFPPMMLYMIASGEQSGELETMLEQAAVNQEREFDTQVGLALGLFEPALVVMMAGVVLFIVIAILEPMLQLNNMVGM